MSEIYEDEYPFGGFPRNQESPFAQIIKDNNIPKADPIDFFSDLYSSDAVTVREETNDTRANPTQTKER